MDAARCVLLAEIGAYDGGTGGFVSGAVPNLQVSSRIVALPLPAGAGIPLGRIP